MTEEQKNAFINAYEALCKEHKLTLVPYPQYKFSAERTEWNLQIFHDVVELKVQDV